MMIYVDADAFPNALKEILLRAILKRGITTHFIANKKNRFNNEETQNHKGNQNVERMLQENM